MQESFTVQLDGQKTLYTRDNLAKARPQRWLLRRKGHATKHANRHATRHSKKALVPSPRARPLTEKLRIEPQAVYSSLFDWAVSFVNLKLKQRMEPSDCFIGEPLSVSYPGLLHQ